MSTEELPSQIRQLVDSLRKQNTAALSLADVASVTEILMGTMQVYFGSIDTSVYKECRALSDYITDARKEIASLQPSDLESSRIPRAGLELDAIVQATENATNTIMEAAEEIMGADTEDFDKYQATANDAVMRIFEACSFQDITGQRISKVVETLSYIEQRVLELRDLLGVTEEDIEVAQDEHQEELEEKALLSGPALDNEGINQDDVDALLNDMGGAPDETADKPKAEDKGETPTAEAAKEAAPAPEEKPTPPPAKAKPAKPAPPPPPEPPVAVNPKMLDSMFEEEFDPEKEQAASKNKEKAEKPAKAAKPAKEEKKDEKVDLPAGEEVSQDDIDALFG